MKISEAAERLKMRKNKKPSLYAPELQCKGKEDKRHDSIAPQHNQVQPFINAIPNRWCTQNANNE
jgi:hypothetical protein